jgi:VanZ family protein
MGVIFYMSDQSGSELQSLFPFLDSLNWGHFVAYFVLAVLLYGAVYPISRKWDAKLWIIFFCLIYGITDEWHQSYVPHRTPDLLDLFNDTFGATVGMLLFHWRDRKIAK